MGRVFNTTGVCIPEKHYMVNINGRLQQIRELVDAGKYFTINRVRQYGKTTTLRALAEMFRDEYYVVLLDFKTFDNEKFRTKSGNLRRFNYRDESVNCACLEKSSILARNKQQF